MCMIIVKNYGFILQKIKEVKARVDLNGNRIGSENGIVSISGIRTLDAWLIFIHAKNQAIFFQGPTLQCSQNGS